MDIAILSILTYNSGGEDCTVQGVAVTTVDDCDATVEDKAGDCVITAGSG